MWEAKVFTLYPDIFPGLLDKGLYGRALSKKIWDLKIVDIRDAAEDKHKTVDDAPFGGGSGMLIKPDVLAKSIDKNKKNGERIFYLSPKGKKLDQKLAKELSQEKSISLICGHFEGVDERLLSTRNIEEISIGDFILSGGETAAFIVLDCILRLLPGVLGNDKSKNDESFERAKKMGVLEKNQIFEINDLAKGEVMFSATGVTDGTLLKGVRINNNDAHTHSVVMRSKTNTVRYINAKHNLNIKKYRSYFK